MCHCDVVVDQSSGGDCIVVCAACVDRPQDRRVAGSDRLSAAMVLGANVYEVGIRIEGRREGVAISRVPGRFERGHEFFDRGAVGRIK